AGRHNVRIVRSRAELAEGNFGREPVFAQRYLPNDGRDRKIYAIGGQIFGVKKVFPRRTEEEKHGELFPLSPELQEVALSCGRAFGIDLYGVDIIESEGKPYVVDMCSIPGFKGVPDAPRLLAQYFYAAAERAARGQPVPQTAASAAAGAMPLSKRTMSEVLTEGVREHPAVQAWLQLQSDSGEPSSLELLQRRRHSTIYRLGEVRQDGARVIAKRCRTATAQIEHTIYQELLPLAG